MTQNFVCACLNVRVCHCAYLCVSLCVGHCVWAILCGPFCVDHFVCIIVFKRFIVFVIDCQCACYCVLSCFLLCTSLCVCIYCVCHSVSVRLFVQLYVLICFFRFVFYAFIPVTVCFYNFRYSCNVCTENSRLVEKMYVFYILFKFITHKQRKTINTQTLITYIDINIQRNIE